MFKLSLTRGAEKKEVKSPDWELILLRKEIFNAAIEDDQNVLLMTCTNVYC